MSFASVQKKIAKRSGEGMAAAGAMLAAGTRRAGAAARKKNPKLNRVKGAAKAPLEGKAAASAKAKYNDHGHHGRVTSIRALEDGKHVEVEVRHGRRGKKSKDGMPSYDNYRHTSRVVMPKGHPALKDVNVGSHAGVGVTGITKSNPADNFKGGGGKHRAKKGGKKKGGGGKGGAGNKRSPSPIATAMGYKQGPESYGAGDDDGGE